MEMCNQNTTTDTLQALVSDSSVAQQHSKCVCSVRKTSDDYASVLVKYFNCDTDSCPWKLKFYEDDGCVKKEFCCGQAPKDFSYKFHTSGHFLIAYEAQSGSSTYSSVRINLIGGE